MISVKGNVLKSPDPNDTSKTLLISDGRHVISVNFGSIDEIPHDLSVNSKIKVTGIAVLDAELWRSGRAQPRIHGYTVVLRRPDDIIVISRPPWWTPGRLMVIIGILVLVLLFILIWIRILNRLVNAVDGNFSRAAIKFHLLELYRKLNVSNRTEAVSIAMKRHLLGD